MTQVVENRLSLLRKAGADSLPEQIFIRDDPRLECEPHNAAPNLRRRAKGAGRNVKQLLGFGIRLDEHRQVSAFARSRRREHALDDLALQHHHHFSQTLALQNQSLEYGGGDVVRKVRGESRASGGLDLGAEVGRQCVAHDKFEVCAIGETFEQQRLQLPVKFDGDDASRAFEKRGSKRTSAWSNLDDRFVRLWIESFDYALNSSRVFEEMLGQPFQRPF